MSVKVILATTVPGLDKIFGKPEFRDYQLLKTVKSRSELDGFMEETAENPEILFYVNGVPAGTSAKTVEEYILDFHADHPNIRIVFAAGEFSPDNTSQGKMLAKFVKAGIYDIITGSKLKTTSILTAFASPKTLDDVKSFLSYDSGEDTSVNTGRRNIVACYSLKPGSGKSMLAVNLASAIAKFGQKKRSGEAPRVAIIDGDLTGLSVGAILHMENPQYNLRAALKQIADLMDEEGKIREEKKDQVESVRRSIRRCFVRSPKLSNLYAMVSANISFDDLASIQPEHFKFLLESVYSAFDVVIVDMNSSLEHRTTHAIFEEAGRVYFLLDPDYNNIKNNIRYQAEVSKLGIEDRIRYILNKDIPEDEMYQYVEDLDYTLSEFENVGLEISHSIPMIDPNVINNRTFHGVPIVLDRTPDILPAADAILEIANEIWKIDPDAVKTFREEDKSEKKTGIMSVFGK